MLNIHISIASLLIDVEAQLRALQLWDDEPPPLTALQSPEPFCIDTLAFYQWVQFVFLPRMRVMIERNIELPGNCQITPMVEQYFAGTRYDGSNLVDLFKQIDDVLSGVAQA